MTQVVYKYEIRPGVSDTIVPKGATLLHGALQGSRMFVWALVDTTEDEKELRHVLFTGTGHRVPDGTWRHLNTILVQNGEFVFHVFEGVRS